jgi:hypothetical protein
MRSFIQGIKNLIKWFPYIWKDRDYDYTYTLELLKRKLLFQAISTRRNSNHSSAIDDANLMEECAILLHAVQREVYIDEVISSNETTEERMKEAIELHNEARIKAFAILSENIEHWWY